MPNTLAHIGLNSLVTRSLARDADLKWIYLGCVLPDLPWIFQRAVRGAADPQYLYDLRLYAIAQASLLLCLILAACLACLSTRNRQVFAILASGSVFHLVLDALQTKWANGVHLFAPLSWEILNFELFWPEGIPSLMLTLFGLIYYISAWRRVPPGPFDLALPRGRTLFLCIGCLVAYLLLPWAFMPAVEAADSHYVGTLRKAETRAEKYVEFDRIKYRRVVGEGALITWAGEKLAVQGLDLRESGSVSIRGQFVDQKTVQVSAVHLHPSSLRDMSSYVGLGLVLLAWIRPLWSLRGIGSRR